MWTGTEGGGLAQVRPQVRVDVHVEPEQLTRTLREEALAGLTAPFKELGPKWLYDDAGSHLFEEITRLPEYYPTRCEREILEARAEDIARASGADTLVELGSGTSEKTRLLLDAFARRGGLRRFVPFDVSENTLRQAAAQVAERYGGLSVHAVAGDFEQHLGRLPGGGRRMVAFLGGTIGNLKPAQRRAFLASLADTMSPGDTLLVGTDLVKDRTRLVRAYDDAAGVTAAFNKNVLVRLNRELGADFEPAGFQHVALFDERHSWIEMRLRAKTAQVVRVPQLGLTVHFGEGEELRTEVSTKFRPQQVRTELSRAGFQVVRWWTDRAGDFALSLAVRVHG